jgi:hypothetical protein
MGAKIRQLDNKGQRLVRGEPEKLQKRPTKVSGRLNCIIASIRARTRSLIVSCTSSGTHTAVKSPERC